MCVDANGTTFDSFQKFGLNTTECGGYCTREPKCDGYYHVFQSGTEFCSVLGSGLALTVWMKRNGKGGVWPIAKAKEVTNGPGNFTCYRKIATTTGNIG